MGSKDISSYQTPAETTVGSHLHAPFSKVNVDADKNVDCLNTL